MLHTRFPTHPAVLSPVPPVRRSVSKTKLLLREGSNSKRMTATYFVLLPRGAKV
jgi:hypothetical protein